VRTVLIGLDGATFDLLDPLMADGVMPFLQRFAETSARASLRSTPTCITPQAWTSLATGRAPGSHGIFDFVRPEETDAGVYIKLLSANDVQCETLWSMASRQDRTVTLLNYPVTYPAPRVHGFVIPASVTVRHLRRAVRPPELLARLEELPGFDVSALAMDMDVEKKGIQGLPADEYEPWLRAHLRRDEHWARAAVHLIRSAPTDLTAIVFDTPDRVGHLAWPLIDPAMPLAIKSSWEERVRDLCLECFRRLDGYVADIVAAAGPETDVFIVSDHGFGPTWDIFYLNRWLEQNGYLSWGPAGAPVDDAESLLAQQLKAQYGLIDWRRTVAYAMTPSANGVHIRVASSPGRDGVAPAAYESLRDELVQGLLAVPDPHSGEPVVREVLTREEVFAGPEMHHAPDLTLVLRDYGFISVLNSDVPVKRRVQAKGLHRPDGIFLARGPGLRRGDGAGQLSIMDVFPALLHTLDLSAPEGLDGRLPAEFLVPSAAASGARPLPTRPPEPRVATPPAGDVDGEQALSATEEEAVLARLRALGYLE
jgi:predicted AlkP superfamily phosphohydrolase/phosphomutase